MTTETANPTLFTHIPHPRIEARAKAGPPTVDKVIAAHASRNRAARFNSWLAVHITNVVGTMWCAYTFAIIALVGLPASLGLSFVPARFGTVVLWVSSEFIQLVLLAVIIVGQNIASASSDARAIATFKDAEAILATAVGLEAHLQAQDTRLSELVAAQEKVLADLRDTAAQVSTSMNGGVPGTTRVAPAS
jgi:hypothetical protein